MASSRQKTTKRKEDEELCDEFVSELSNDDLILAMNYLNVPPLLDTLNKRAADRVKKKIIELSGSCLGSRTITLQKRSTRFERNIPRFTKASTTTKTDLGISTYPVI
ncbi:hypothetical protein LINGRAHAP2_LOCUS5055 [Linum grandiflorum]